MPSKLRPRVAVIGGFFNLAQDEEQGKKAREYAQEIGKALAEAGFGLVVYFSDDQSLEPHVVRGFVEGLPPDESTPCIDMRYSEKQRGQIKFKEQETRPKIFNDNNPFPGQNWEAPFYRSLAARDGVQAVLLMAGGQSTLNAGQVAVGRGLPILAIDKFDGSAQILRSELATKDATYPSSQGSNASELAAWLFAQHVVADDVIKKEQECFQKLERMTHQRRGITWTSLALVVLLIALGAGLIGVDSPRWFIAAIGGSLISAGATGALLRGMMTPGMTFEPRLACLLGIAAGIVVGLAYLIPQLIGAPQLLEPHATIVKATDKIQLLSVTLVALTAGIGFDAIFRRLLQEADKVPVNIVK